MAKLYRATVTIETYFMAEEDDDADALNQLARDAVQDDMDLNGVPHGAIIRPQHITALSQVPEEHHAYYPWNGEGSVAEFLSTGN